MSSLTQSPESLERATTDWARPVFEAAPNAMVMVDAFRRIVLVNRATEVLFGYVRAELVGQLLETLVPERYRSAHPACVEVFHREPQARAMGAGRELYGRRHDGSEVPIEIGLNFLETADGKFTLASIIDVSERRRIEERFRLVVESATSALIMTDEARQITLVNRRAEELFGHRRAQLVGQPFLRLVPPRFHAAIAEITQSVGATSSGRVTVVEHDLHGLREDGHEVPIELVIDPIATRDGTALLASIADLTERKRAEALQARLAAIVEYSEDAILSKTLDGTITSWNRGAAQLFGYAAEEAIGQSVLMLVPPRLHAEEARLLAALRGNDRLDHFESVRRRKDGTEVAVSVQISPIRNAEGEIVGESKITRDITELKRRDAELQRSNAELEQFAYVASHDLQEPLRMVANYTELLAQRYQGRLDDRADKYIRYASQGARRMQRLVADLLAYSRVGSQGKPFARVSAAAAVEQVLASLQRVVRESGASVVLGELPDVYADEVQLQQLFQNLIGNSIKFRSDATPRVEIAAVAAEGFWKFSVSDNGIGLDPRYADRIFQMFQRLHPAGKYDGSGIGLAIAKRIVERHAGQLWVESSLGAGTTFHFTLPAGRGAG